MRDEQTTAPGSASRIRPHELVPGTRYEVLRWLGQGGMGIVFEAKHVDIERRAALKIPTHVVSDARVARILRDEARTASRCGSPNIVEIFDVGELPDGRTWIAMEFLDGKSLADLLESESFDPARLIAVTRQICRGLGAAHAAGIVHGDVKPDNVILVTHDRRADMVKLVDFGVAAVLAADDGAVAGTPMYMPPEQILGLPWDGRLDIYALGCLLYQAVTGAPPFMGSSVKEILLCHLEEAPTPPSVKLDADPGPLDDVIMRCLEKRPEDRYADMADLEAAVCEAQIAAGIHTAWDDLPLPEVEQGRRARLLTGMPDPATLAAASYRTRWALPAAIVGSLALGGAAAFAVFAPTEQVEPVPDRAVELADAARDAAARALFVYPLPSEPDGPTAFTMVRELEALADGAGADAARALRQEFAQTLVRLGDTYWEREGGRDFAVEFYVQASMFDPGNERARGRSFLTPGRQASLASRAETLQFDGAELEVAEVLEVLGDPDQRKRKRKLASYLSRRSSLGAVADRNIEKLAQDEGVVVVPEEEERVRSRPDSTGDKPQRGAAMTDSAEIAERSSAAPKPRDADKLARRGLGELRAGRAAAAQRLFHRALDLDPRNDRALGGLSSALFESGRYGEAVRYGEKAVARAPGNAGHRIQLGDAYYKMNRYSTARQQYEKAKQLGHRHAARRLLKIKEKLGG